MVETCCSSNREDMVHVISITEMKSAWLVCVLCSISTLICAATVGWSMMQVPAFDLLIPSLYCRTFSIVIYHNSHELLLCRSCVTIITLIFIALCFSHWSFHGFSSIWHSIVWLSIDDSVWWRCLLCMQPKWMNWCMYILVVPEWYGSSEIFW